MDQCKNCQYYGSPCLNCRECDACDKNLYTTCHSFKDQCLNCVSYGFPCLNCLPRECIECNKNLYTCERCKSSIIDR